MIQNQNRSFRRFFFIGAIVAIIFPPDSFAQNSPRRQLHGHVPEMVRHLTPIGTVPTTKNLQLSIGLPLRNKAELETLLKNISDPSNPDYRHYLTPEQFDERFGPTEKDYQQVADFFRKNGFTVTGTTANRMLLDVSGSVKNIERTFRVTLRNYRHPTENRIFYAPDVEPSIDSAVPILDVAGLSDLPQPRPKVVLKSPLGLSGAPKNGVGSGPAGSYIGNDFRATYAPGVSFTGAGQTVALVQFDGYYLKDITNYENFIGIAPANYVTLSNILLDNFNGKPTTGPGSGNIEVSLDIEMVISMAPGVSKIILYEGNPGTGHFFPNHVLNCIATNNAAKQISSSWGWSGGPDATTEQIFQQMRAQGQTYFNASGDSDAFTPGQLDNPSEVTQPSGSANIIQVGATTLTATNPVSETVWNWGGGTGSSGGVSTATPIPDWQTGISMMANHGSTTGRNVPDVALTGDNVFVKYGNGLNATNVGGTSCAAPLWAGLTALINQCAAAAEQPPVGFINPALYTIGKSGNYSAAFHDVVNGNNFWSSSPTNYPAVAGYDLCTGWGTPNGNYLINALAIPDALYILPSSGFTANGVTGGPFDIPSQNFLLTNRGNSSLNWSFVNPSNLLDASATSGTLAVGGTATVNVHLTSIASNLLAGTYSPFVTFSNQSSGIGQGLQFNLRIGQSPVQNAGFESGTFTNFVGWIFVGDGYDGSNGFFYDGIVSGTTFAGGDFFTNYVHSGTYGAAFGEVDAPAWLYQNIPTFPGQSYLISFWLNNVKGATPNRFIVNWNTNPPATNTIYDATDLGVLEWTNFTFIVTATGTNTVFQIGAENDTDYFGFDDVSITPIPTPTFRSVMQTNNVISATFNSLAGVQYQIQYTTNLAATNWFISSINTALGPTLTLTNSIGTNSSRFYRIRRLP